jgi:hypothetical protein
MSREAADFSKADALAAMAIEASTVENASPDDFIAELKKAYKRQALRLHPDKCPDGPGPFLKMQAAYRLLLALAQGEAEEGGGPRSHRLSLLLRAQCLLYTRFPDIVGEFTYPAYDTLLSLLHTSLDAGGVTHELVRPCMELAWLTLNACPDNAPFLGDKGAVPGFVNVLRLALGDAPVDSPPTGPQMIVAALTLRGLALVLRSREARNSVLDLPEGDRAVFLTDLLRCTRLERATNVAAAALDVVASAASSLEIQQELVQRGALGHIFVRMLRCVCAFSQPLSVPPLDLCIFNVFVCPPPRTPRPRHEGRCGSARRSLRDRAGTRPARGPWPLLHACCGALVPSLLMSLHACLCVCVPLDVCIFGLCLSLRDALLGHIFRTHAAVRSCIFSQ